MLQSNFSSIEMLANECREDACRVYLWAIFPKRLIINDSLDSVHMNASIHA